MTNAAVPRAVARYSDRALVVALAGAALTAAAHFTGWLAWNPTLLLYLVFISAAAVCGVNSAVARCHLAIGQAFVAGVQQGRSEVAPVQQVRSRVPGLRAVD